MGGRRKCVRPALVRAWRYHRRATSLAKQFLVADSRALSPPPQTKGVVLQGDNDRDNCGLHSPREALRRERHVNSAQR